MKTSESLAGLLVISATLVLIAPVRGQSVKMRLEIELDHPTCRVLENFTLKVRVVNPNRFPVILPGFEMGYSEPEIHLVLENGETIRLYYGTTDSTRTKIPIPVPAGGVLESHRFLFSDFSHERWPVEPGVFVLCGKTHISSCRLTLDGEQVPIEWEIPEISVRVEGTQGKDREAMQFLTDRLQDDGSKEGRKRVASTHRIRIFGEFLERFDETVYAPEIRWELSKLLKQEIGERQSPYYKDLKMIALLDECLRFCVERGGAYAEEFTRWDATRGDNYNFEFALMFGRLELLRQLVGAIDARYPDDTAAKLYRKVGVLGVTESMVTASAALKELEDRFPESEYVGKACMALRSIERSREAEKNDKTP